MAQPSAGLRRRIQHRRPNGDRRVVRVLTALLVVGLAAVVTVAGWLAHFATAPIRIPETARRFSIDQGVGLRKVAASLEHQGIVSSATAFVWLARAMGRAGELKAGIYEAGEALTPLQLLDKLVRGDFAKGQIRFIEGWTFHQLRLALDANPALRHDSKDLTGQQILARLGIPETQPEGLFFPDTYQFSAGTSDLVVLHQAHLRMQVMLAQFWAAREKRLPYHSQYEALILASIVEKESASVTERDMVAAVFVNRLRRGMKLQADPTVIYGLGEHFDGNLRKRDLLTDQPYNTYTRYGLPPTPISLPGEASLRAALNPAPSKVLYFVSRGDGSHHFSETLAEHNRAVNKFQRGL